MVEPISLDEAKANLKIDADNEAEDDLIVGYISAAREYCESETGLMLVPTSTTETAPRLARWIDLAAWPVTSIDEVRYTAADGTMQVLDPGAYRFSLKRRPFRITPTAWNWGLQPTCDRGWDGRREVYMPVEVDLTGGFATPDLVPFAVRQAIQLMIAHFYTNRLPVEVGTRAAAIEVPIGVGALLSRSRLDLI